MDERCKACRGACCKIVILPVDIDEAYWELRGAQQKVYGYHSIELECQALAENGSCRVYPNRPYSCREFVVGGQYCRMAQEIVNGPSG